MDGGPLCGEDVVNIDWDSEDDREIDAHLGQPFDLQGRQTSVAGNTEVVTSPTEASFSMGSSQKGADLDRGYCSKSVDHFVAMGFPAKMVAEAIRECGEDNSDTVLETLLKSSAPSSEGPSGTKVIDHFLGMGFSDELVVKAIQENGEENTDSILEALLTYSAIEKSPQELLNNDSDIFSSENDGSSFDDFSDIDLSEDEEIKKLDEESPLRYLAKMGYSVEEASIAIERCGPNATVAELTDFICAAQIAKSADPLFPEEKPKTKIFDDDYPKHKKRSYLEYDKWKKKQKRRLENEIVPPDEEMIRLPNPMIGFGIPTEPGVTHPKLPEAAAGPPYFYYENVALAPKGVWTTISRFLYDVEPEFVDSLYISASARKRGYVHNLPIENRYPLLPYPPQTIHEALPLTKRWWPAWDTRTKFNCLQTCIASAKLTERILKAVERYDGDPPLSIQKYVLEQCKKWNLVWVGRNKVAPLEPDEVEMLLGFPRNHTRGGGISRTDRYKSLGNSFQIDTVAYHFSVLKELYPEGLNLLSLFSGIGGAEVALHRLGIKMKNVVAVEILEANRGILRCWWEQTNQTGNLIEISDVQQLDSEKLEQLMSTLGGFDFVVGGSPCNNLTGSNRHHRDGLQGKHSALFFDFCRILDLVKCIMGRGQSN